MGPRYAEVAAASYAFPRNNWPDPWATMYYPIQAPVDEDEDDDEDEEEHLILLILLSILPPPTLLNQANLLRSSTFLPS